VISIALKHCWAGNPRDTKEYKASQKVFHRVTEMETTDQKWFSKCKTIYLIKHNNYYYTQAPSSMGIQFI
jgi:hypothetical protein